MSHPWDRWHTVQWYDRVTRLLEGILGTVSEAMYQVANRLAALKIPHLSSSQLLSPF